MKRSPCGRSRRLSLSAGVAAFVIALCCQTSFAQQPFITDDADVTPRHKLHFEFSNEYDVLQRASFPSLKQNIAEFELDYGLFENVEIGVVTPLSNHRCRGSERAWIGPDGWRIVGAAVHSQN